MGEAGAAGLLARRPDVIPDVHRQQRDGVILVQDHVQAVGQRELRERHIELPSVPSWRSRLLTVKGEAGRQDAGRNDRARRFHRTDSNTLGDVFSGRVPHERRPNRLSAALSHAKATRGLLDLTLSNPTRAGIRYPSSLLAPLAQPGGLTYCPEPFGLLDARQAIAECYARRGVRRRARSGRSDRQYERGVLAPVQAPVRSCPDERADARAQLPPVRPSDQPRRRRAASLRARISRDLVDRGRRGRSAMDRSDDRRAGGVPEQPDRIVLDGTRSRAVDRSLRHTPCRVDRR